MADHCVSVLYTAEELAKKTKELGAQISADYQGKDLLLVGLLKGAVVFFADLMREISLPLQMDFMMLSSYGSGTSSSGTVTLERDLPGELCNKDVLLVEDILDSGHTLSFVLAHLKARGARSVRICTLLRKKSRMVKPVTVDYLGFDIEDLFVVGYGLDYDGAYRQLPFIGQVRFDCAEQ